MFNFTKSRKFEVEAVYKMRDCWVTMLEVGLVLGTMRVVSLEDLAKHFVIPFSVMQWIIFADLIIFIGP